MKAVIAISQPAQRRLRPDEPDTDFWRLAGIMDAPVIGNTVTRSGSPLARIERVTALDIGQAVHILRTYPRADVYISFSERVGIPLGMLLSRRKHRPAHVVIAHKLDSRAKRWLGSFAHWQNGVDRIITLCSAQLEHAERLLPGKAVFVMGGTVDNDFYTPGDSVVEDYILSVGSEQRDYDTLVDAAALTGLKVRVLSSSPWSRQTRRRSQEKPTGCVEWIPRVSFADLRDLYRRASCIVLPLQDASYVAGHNGLLEAFCTARPVVVSESRGITDYVRHGSNAYIVPVHDSERLAQAMLHVVSDKHLQSTLIAGGREAVRAYANLSSYVQTLADQVALTIESAAV